MKLRFLICRIAAFLALCLWLVAAGAQESPYRWRITLDAPADVRELLEQYLDIYRYRNRPEVDALLLQRITSRTAEDARQLLATAGYFSPQVEAALDPVGGESVVRLRIDPGKQAQVASAAIKITGVIAENPAENMRREQIVSRWRLPATSTFRQAAWDDAKDALLKEFLFDGYPAARITASEAEVNPQSGQVSISITIDSGPLFHFGPLQINGLSRYPKSIIENLNRIRAGERYTYDAVVQYQTVLQGSGYFQSASVNVEPEAAQAGAAPIVVRVTEYPAMKIDLGVGYSTDARFRSEATFTHNNTFKPGWQGLARLRLDSTQQLAGAELAFLPEDDGWRNRIGTGAVHSDIENQSTRTVGITARRTWQSPEREHDWSLKFQVEEQSITAGPVDHLEALSLNYSWTRRKVDDLLRPRRGHMVNLQLGGASQALLSTRSFARTYARGLYILPMGDTDRVHLRGEFGAVWAEARDGIPSEFLFRTGGDQTVRGYAYQSLGVTQGVAIVDGRYLGVASVEYQHDFTREWGGAMFVDAGNAADTPSLLRPVYGYGVGVRWYTPAGSINLDIARGQETGKLRLHFTIGARF